MNLMLSSLLGANLNLHWKLVSLLEKFEIITNFVLCFTISRLNELSKWTGHDVDVYAPKNKTKQKSF